MIDYYIFPDSSIPFILTHCNPGARRFRIPGGWETSAIRQVAGTPGSRAFWRSGPVAAGEGPEVHGGFRVIFMVVLWWLHNWWLNGG